MKNIKTYAAMTASAVALMLLLSACGESSDSSSGRTQTGSSAGRTVSVASVDGVGNVLVDAEGAALYASNEEAGGMVLCTGSCTTIWDPLTVGGRAPTGENGLGQKLDVVARPDGARQVAFDGRLLYRFTEDPSAGTVTGNGFADSFAGQAFTWHVVTRPALRLRARTRPRRAATTSEPRL
jgi:predicted lipoprotein with Yx(FWY)xxD motif